MRFGPDDDEGSRNRDFTAGKLVDHLLVILAHHTGVDSAAVLEVNDVGAAKSGRETPHEEHPTCGHGGAIQYPPE